MSTNIKPDQTIPHVKTVLRVTNTGKTFNKAGVGQCAKWVVEFTDGYSAELVIPVGQQPADFKEGCKAGFKIDFRGQYGDEISYIDPANVGDKPKPVSGQGHPAVTALAMAKDLQVARIRAMGTLPAKKPDDMDMYSIAEMLSDADMIYEWLHDKLVS